MLRSLHLLLATGAATAAAVTGGPGAAAATPAPDGGATVAHVPSVTYCYAGFPASGDARVHSVSTPSGTALVTLSVTGLAPSRTYGAHAHTAPCGPSGLAAGPHWQLADDPVSPSTDPAYANPRNEVWLDVTTDAAGNGTSRAVLDVAFPDGDQPASVIIHERRTSTGHGDGSAGTAGARLACLTVPF